MGVESDMRSIGEMGRDSGLGVSALRFYDRAGVLVPAWVDPVTGYRWYAPEQFGEARLLARLRRSGMPLADIRLVLAGWAAGTPAWCPGCSTGICGGSNAGWPTPARSSPPYEPYSDTRRPP